MAGLADLLQGILGQIGQSGGPAVTAVGDHADPAAMQAQFARFRQSQGAPAQAPQMPQQGLAAPQTPQGQPMPEQAPQGAPGPQQGGSFGDGISGLLQNLFNPQASARNQTVGWLTKQGLDQGTATLLASNKPALQSYLLQHAKGNGPTEFDQRAVAARQYGLDPSTPEGRSFILSGKLDDGEKSSLINAGAGNIYDPRTGKWITAPNAEGTKAPTVQKLKLDDGSEMAVQWNAETGAWDPINAPQGGIGIAPKTKLTESQSKLTLFQSLQTESQPVLLDLEKQFDPANIADAAARSTPIAGNFFQSEQGQMYQSAATAWAEGALRIATGAAATPEEMERTKKAYFAQVGDTPVTIAFKAQMREMYNRSIERALGNKNDETLPKPSEFVKQFTGEAKPSAGAGDTPPASYTGSPESWKFVKPEDRALWQ